MPTPKSKLSKFILSLPSTLSGSQVVERAKAKGMKTSGANVYRVRGLFGTKAVKTSATVTRAGSNAASISKSDFIRAQPASLSVAEVIAKGKAEGIKIGSSLVYMVRGRTHKKARRTGASVPRPITTTSSSAEDLLRAVAAELGLGRAIEILAGERARVQFVLRR